MDFIEKYYHSDIDGSPVGDLKLRYCGHRLDAPNHSFGPAARDNFWLIYLKSGEGVYEVGGQSYRIESGDIFCAFPNRRIFYKADEGSIWSIYWVSIAGERIGEYLTLAGINAACPVVRVLDNGATVDIFEQLLGEIPGETLKSKLRTTSLLYALTAQLTLRERPARQRDYFDEAVLFMSNNYINPLSMNEISKRLSLDRSYFARMFKRRSGMSPLRWLTEYRLTKSCELLRVGGLRISEVARSVGYPNPLYFTRIFSKRFGISPSEWRNLPEAVSNSEKNDILNSVKRIKE